MQFEPDFRFDMDDGFASMCGPCPSTTNSFSSAASSAYDPFTPTSRRSTPNELHLDLDGCAFNPHGHASHHHSPLDMTPPSTAVPKYFMGGPVKHEHGDHMPPFADSLPTTPMKRMDSFSTEYDLLDLNSQLGTMTPSHSSYTINPEAAMGPSSYMMTPTQSLSGSEMADSSSSWSVPNESPIQFFSRDMSLGDVESLDLDRHSVSPLHHPAHSHYRAAGPDRRMMLHEAQRKTSELQRAQQMRATRKRPAPGAAKPDSGSVDVVRRAMCKCDYPGCHKAFRRNEHLKRHKQTYHGEGPNRFSCEFCGKDQFNRQDNLNNHRKLHARPNSRNRGVEFIPAAVPIIEQEERSRKRRAPPKSKSQKSDYDF